MADCMFYLYQAFVSIQYQFYGGWVSDRSNGWTEGRTSGDLDAQGYILNAPGGRSRDDRGPCSMGDGCDMTIYSNVYETIVDPRIAAIIISIPTVGNNPRVLEVFKISPSPSLL